MMMRFFEEVKKSHLRLAKKKRKLSVFFFSLLHLLF